MPTYDIPPSMQDDMNVILDPFPDLDQDTSDFDQDYIRIRG